MNKDIVRNIVKEYQDMGLLEDKTLGEELERCAEVYKDKIALVDDNGSISYQELWQEANKIAIMFLDNGIKKKDNIIVQLPNGILFMKVCFALFLIGARPVLMLQTHGDLELNAVASVAKPVAVITSKMVLGVNYESMAVRLKENIASIKKIFIDGETTEGININNYENVEFKEGKIKDKPDSSDIALFLLSGGTTGTPKLIPKIHAAYICNAKESSKRCDVTENSVYLAVLSISHDLALCTPGVLGTLINGGKSVLCKTAGLEEVMDYIKEEKVTFVSLAPVLAKLWMESLEWIDDVDFSSFKYVLIGAAKLDYDLAKKIEDTMGVKIIQGYGLGEGITCFTTIHDKREIAWSCQGKPISEGDVVKIVDENNNELPRGEAGELIQKGPYTFLGYYRAPDLNKKAFTEDGFFKTGDKAMITPEGNILILGRVKEQINRAGENIIPEEIETMVKKCEYIKEASVLGLPDEKLGEKICVVAIKNEKEISLMELCKFLSSIGMAKFKLPDELVYLPKLPYKNVGKVDKVKLKQLLCNNREVNQ